MNITPLSTSQPKYCIIAWTFGESRWRNVTRVGITTSILWIWVFSKSRRRPWHMENDLSFHSDMCESWNGMICNAPRFFDPRPSEISCPGGWLNRGTKTEVHAWIEGEGNRNSRSNGFRFRPQRWLLARKRRSCIQTSGAQYGAFPYLISRCLNILVESIWRD